METRSLQITGGSSYTISLPKKWVEENNLKEKDLVEIYLISRERLLLQRPHTYTRRESYLDPTNLTNEQIKRELLGYYISGVEEIIIKSKNMSYEQRAIVRKVCNRLLGFESFEINDKEISLKGVSVSSFPTSELLQKMIEIIITMHSDLVSVFLSSNMGLARDIIARDEEIDKIYTAIIRQLNKTLYNPSPEDALNPNTIDLHFYTHISLRLERLADHIVRICKAITMLNIQRNVELTRTEINDYKRTGKGLVACQKIIKNMNKSEIHKILDLLSQKKKGAYLNKTIKNKKTLNILVEESTDRIKSYLINIAEDTLNFLLFKENIT